MTLIYSVVLPWQPLLVPLPRLTCLQDSPPQPLHPPPPPTLTCSLVCRHPLLQSHLALVHLAQQLLQDLVLLPWIFLMALVCPPSHPTCHEPPTTTSPGITGSSLPPHH